VAEKGGPRREREAAERGGGEAVGGEGEGRAERRKRGREGAWR
jgi:hypothetical protein